VNRQIQSNDLQSPRQKKGESVIGENKREERWKSEEGEEGKRKEEEMVGGRRMNGTRDPRRV
jgi:hypothetical protein